MPKHSQLPKTREYQVIKTVIEDAIDHIIPTRGIAGAPRYGAGIVAIGSQYTYKSPAALRGINNIRIRIQEAYAEVNKEIAERIVIEYKMLIREAGAIARGSNDPKSLMNALHVVQDPKRLFDFHIEVVNRVWLYQEYGFDMKGKVPGLGVQKRILQWAIDKGIVGVLRSGHDLDYDKRGRKRYKYAIKQRASKYYERADVDIIEEDEEEESLLKFMYYITKLVVEGNTNEYNGRLFLTHAYWNIISDKTLIHEIERKYLLLHRVVSK